jgi:hypothetical protein
MLWASIGKALLPVSPPKPDELAFFWADVGIYLADREPEFQPGPGRLPGSKSKKPRLLVDTVSKATIRKRRSRNNQRDRELAGN